METTGLITIEFKDSKSIHSNNLIALSEEYKKHLAILIPFLKKEKGKIITITIARLDNNGNWKKNEVKGVVKEVTNNNFIFVSNQDLHSSALYDFEKETLIHFHNITGDVPIMLGVEIDPFSINDSELFSVYFDVLEKMKDLMNKYINKGKIKILLRVNQDLPPKTGIRTVEGQIRKVNGSNVEIYQVSSNLLWDDKSIGGSDLLPGNESIKFVTPTEYLFSICINPEAEAKANSFDDYEG